MYYIKMASVKLVKLTVGLGGKALRTVKWNKVYESNKTLVRNICGSGLKKIPEVQLKPTLLQRASIDLVEKLSDRKLTVKFADDSNGVIPYIWLRDNCQCSQCFDANAKGRIVIMQDIDKNCHPKSLEHDSDVLKIVWNDGHESSFDSEWLHKRAFNDRARQDYQKFFRHPREPWNKNFSPQFFDYNSLMKNEQNLLKFLMNMEKFGAAVVAGTPNDPDAGAQLAEKIGFVKSTHFGRRSPVIVRANPNNVAWTNKKLGLHTDLCQYNQQAGVIFIQTVVQHVGKGGESVISDGLNAIEILRKNHPKEFEILSKTPIYFVDIGQKAFHFEADEWYKINRGPVIGLDVEGKLEILRVNNQVRDSNVDVPAEKVQEFYDAYAVLDQILYDNAYRFKMRNGDILALDNIRCLHGREGFQQGSARHLESCYIDWDEILCRRRRLQGNLGCEI